MSDEDGRHPLVGELVISNAEHDTLLSLEHPKDAGIPRIAAALPANCPVVIVEVRGGYCKLLLPGGRMGWTRIERLVLVS